MKSRQLLGARTFLSPELSSKLLLTSIVLFYVLPALSESREVGRVLLVLNLYVTLVAATMQLAGRRLILWSAIPIAATSMVLLAVSHYIPTSGILIANGIALTLFLVLVSISLFVYLGEPGFITSGRIYISVSLYFLLGMAWFSIYNLLNILQPGSFAEGGAPLPPDTPWSTMLYFSLTTLTTVGYGDIVAVKPAARMLATLEAAAGVLYIAITVARLVAARQTSTDTREQ